MMKGCPVQLYVAIGKVAVVLKKRIFLSIGEGG